MKGRALLFSLMLVVAAISVGGGVAAADPPDNPGQGPPDNPGQGPPDNPGQGPPDDVPADDDADDDDADDDDADDDDADDDDADDDDADDDDADDDDADDDDADDDDADDDDADDDDADDADDDDADDDDADDDDADETTSLDLSELSGAGTAAEPYVITNVTELQAIEEDLDAHYVLGNDIDATATAEWNDGDGFDPIGPQQESNREATPIGQLDGGFSGTFDGNGHVITGLSINQDSSPTGLFTRMDGQVANVTLANATITGDTAVGILAGTNVGNVTDVDVSGTVSGNLAVGGLVGNNGGQIDAATAAVTVDGEQGVGGLAGAQLPSAPDVPGDGPETEVIQPQPQSINASATSGQVNGTGDVGGIVGFSLAPITQSQSNATVTGTDGVGGVAGSVTHFGEPEGRETAIVRQSAATGRATGSESVGGLVGRVTGISETAVVTNSYASVVVSGESSVGGLVGSARHGFTFEGEPVEVPPSQSTTTTLNDTYWDTETSEQSRAIGGDSWAPGSDAALRTNATGLATAQMTGDAARTNMSELDFEETWTTRSESYPALEWQVSERPPTAQNDSYETTGTLAITTAELLANDADPDGDTLSLTGITASPRNGSVALSADTVEYTPNDGFEGADSFRYGVTDGNGETVTATVTVTVTAQNDSVGLPGAGTAQNPYEIRNLSQLQRIEDDTSASYELQANIDAAATVEWNDGAGFDSIGSRAEPFTGTFDGNGYTISNLSIVRSGENDTGLFSYTGAGSTVANVTLSGVTVTGFERVGALVGTNGGTVTNAASSGAVDGTLGVGGLVGYNEGTVVRSSSTTTVTGTQSVGGLVGRNTYDGLVDVSSSSGTVDGNTSVGGLVGTNAATVASSTSSATVSGYQYVGGLVGQTVISSATIQQSSASGTVDGVRNVGGLTGQGGTIVGSYVNASVTGETNVAGLAGSYATRIEESYWNTETTGQSDASGLWSHTDNVAGFSADSIPVDGVDGEPPEIALADLPGEGTAENPYVLTNVSELQAMADDTSASYELGADIDAFKTNGWNYGAGFNPVGTRTDPFTGSLDGNGHTITNLTVDHSSENDTGLFGYIEDGTVEDLVLAEASATGFERVGALVGTNAGTVTDVSVRGTVEGTLGIGGVAGYNAGTIRNVSSATTVTGIESVGGLAGRNTYEGTVQASSSSGTVEGNESVGGLVGTNAATISQSSSSATVSGYQYVGGLVGQTVISTATVRQSVATGSATGVDAVGGLVGQGGTITQSYATTTVSGETNVGGIAGTFAYSVEQTYWDTNTTGQSTLAGSGSEAFAGDDVTGLTTTAMTGATAHSNMSGFDFGDTWQTSPRTYPTITS